MIVTWILVFVLKVVTKDFARVYLVDQGDSLLNRVAIDHKLIAMKSVSFAEFDVLVEAAQRFLGLPVQSVTLDNDVLVLNLGGTSSLRGSLVIDLRNKVPFFTITDRPLPHLQKQTKPIVLFLKAHVLGLKLQSVTRDLEYGRLIIFTFSNDTDSLTIEAHLMPQSRNIRVSFKESTISLKKPQELSKMTSFKDILEKRTAEELYRQWHEQFALLPVKNLRGHSGSLFIEEAILKKQAGLNKLLSNLEVLQKERWAEFAVWLNSDRSEHVLAEYKDLYDTQLSVIENIENAFTQSKKIKIKIQHLEERIKKLQQEIQSLEEQSVSPSEEGVGGRTHAGSSQSLSVSQSLSIAARTAKKRLSPDSPLLGAKGRTRSFDNEIKAYIGKSGTDNLKLLRQSKSWYTWVHAKDWPSAHAIIATNKGQAIPQDVLSEVCLWVLKETLSDKQWASWRGIKVDFVYTERRYLQAVKGDHHGLVRYSQAKTVTIEVRDI